MAAGSRYSYVDSETNEIILRLNMEKMGERMVTKDYLKNNLNFRKCQIVFQEDSISIKSERKLKIRRFLKRILNHTVMGVDVRGSSCFRT